MSRPELGPVAVGDEVLVHEGDPRRPRRIPATIVKVGRIWLTLKSTESGREWRMHREFQDTRSGIGYAVSFATPEQYAYDRRVAEAAELIREQGISVDHHSPWATGDGRLALAALLQSVDSGS